MKYFFFFINLIFQSRKKESEKKSKEETNVKESKNKKGDDDDGKDETAFIFFLGFGDYVDILDLLLFLFFGLWIWSLSNLRVVGIFLFVLGRNFLLFFTFFVARQKRKLVFIHIFFILNFLNFHTTSVLFQIFARTKNLGKNFLVKKKMVYKKFF